MANLKEKLYWYEVERLQKPNFDGDSFWLRIFFGFRHTAPVEVRLFGLNTPKLSAPGGREARDYVRARLTTAAAEGTPVMVESIRSDEDKYGRWLVRLHIDSECLNDTLLELGHAKPYDGTGERS